MFENVLLAFDGSDYSDKALQCAKSITERFEATLWLVHVFRYPSDILGYADYEKLFAKRKSAAQTVLDEARQKLGATTFIVNEEGTIYWKDTDGNTPVTDFPADLEAAGWDVPD